MDQEIIEIPFQYSVSGTVSAQITFAERKEPIVAFVELDFGWMKIRGITVKKRDFKGDGNEVLVFDLPAYRAGIKFHKSVYMEKEIFFEFAEPVLNKVKEMLGEEVSREDEVFPDDIPF